MRRWHASLFANIGEPRAERIYGEIVSRMYSRSADDNGCQKRERERELCVCRYSKPIQFADNSSLLSGNYFRGLGKRVSRLPPSSPKGRWIHAHSRSIATRTHPHAHAHTRARISACRWRSRSPVRGRDRSAPLADAVPEIISFAAKRTRTIPWPSDIEVSASNRFLLGRVWNISISTTHTRALL